MTTSMRGARRTLLGLVGVLFLLQTTGCYSWHATTVPVPEDVIQPGTVLRVTTMDQRRWILADVIQRHDSLIGTTANGTPLQVGIPTATIISTSVRKADAGGAVAAVLGVAIVVLVVQARRCAGRC